MGGETTEVEVGAPRRRIALWSSVGVLALGIAGAGYFLAFGAVSPFAIDQPISFGMQLEPREIEVWYGCTQGVHKFHVLQEPDRIVVRIRARSHSGDCASGMQFTLDQPLDNRIVIDGSTGERVEIQNRLVPERP